VLPQRFFKQQNHVTSQNDARATNFIGTLFWYYTIKSKATILTKLNAMFTFLQSIKWTAADPTQSNQVKSK